jgi:hypothetical protein
MIPTQNQNQFAHLTLKYGIYIQHHSALVLVGGNATLMRVFLKSPVLKVEVGVAMVKLLL